VAQWNIPEDLPPFDAARVSRNRWARVTWLGASRYELAQDASILSCEKLYPSGRQLVTEFDLLASPNNRRVSGVPQATTMPGPDLAHAAQVKADIRLDIRDAQAADTACRVTQTIFLFALVLTNVTQRQTIFYQIRLGLARPATAFAKAHPPESAWFFTGTNIQAGGTGQFGFGDNVTSLGQSWTEPGQQQTYHLDLLGRLRWLIARGSQHGLDQDLSHWHLTGTYHGQAVMGHMRNDAIWSDFSLVID
jgi:hypothetical protein